MPRGNKNYNKGKHPKDYPEREESKKKYRKYEDRMDVKSKDCFTSQANDSMWYAQNPSLLRDAASFPYGWPVGNRLTLDGGAILNQGSIPGVLAFYTNPGFGYAVDQNSPLNMAARNVYAYVRHANSGHSNYDAPDLMLYLLAMDSVYSYHAFLKRIYGLAQAYTPTNRYFPKAIISSMGVDYDDVMTHLAQLRYWINVYQAKFESMRVPSTMSYTARHMWMYSGIYQDGETDKCQIYLYTPHSFYQFGYDEDGAGMLTNVPFMTGQLSNLKTVEQLIQYGNDLINPILSSEDMGIMSGDILKAFGDKVVSLTPVSTDYGVLPVYDKEVLSQMENASMIGYATAASLNLTQKGIDPTTGLKHAWLSWTPEFQMPGYIGVTAATQDLKTGELDPVWRPWTMKRIINFHKDDVQAADTMVATRLSNILTPIPKSAPTQISSLRATCTTMGSDYVSSVAMFYYAGDSDDWELHVSPYIFSGMPYLATGSTTFAALTADQAAAANTIMQAQVNTNNRSSAAMNLALLRLSVFDWHPMVVPFACRMNYTVSSSGNLLTAHAIEDPVGFALDVENYTTMVAHDLERLSEAALLSEFSLPSMGSADIKV